MTTTHQRKEVSLVIVNPFPTEATITFTPLYRVQLNGGERIHIERPECIETRKLEPESGITLFSSQLLNEECRGTNGTWIESDIPIAVSALNCLCLG